MRYLVADQSSVNTFRKSIKDAQSQNLPYVLCNVKGREAVVKALSCPKHLLDNRTAPQMFIHWVMSTRVH